MHLSLYMAAHRKPLDPTDPLFRQYSWGVFHHSEVHHAVHAPARQYQLHCGEPLAGMIPREPAASSKPVYVCRLCLKRLRGA